MYKYLSHNQGHKIYLMVTIMQWEICVLTMLCFFGCVRWRWQIFKEKICSNSLLCWSYILLHLRQRTKRVIAQSSMLPNPRPNFIVSFLLWIIETLRMGKINGFCSWTLFITICRSLQSFLFHFIVIYSVSTSWAVYCREKRRGEGVGFRSKICQCV